MTDIGIEVGQKMRSAIKAKLTELDCYVDDELPDYIMVMIANKRTKTQMKDDLNLFLSTKTSTFVDWLHIVLKKLKEVHVTNPDVFKKTIKKQNDEYITPDEELKKIKKEKKEENKALKRARKEAKLSKEAHTSLTDDLPININKLSEARKIVIMRESQASQNEKLEIDEDNFDIPLLSEINASNEEELEAIEKKIKSVKSRLGIHVESDDDEYLNIKADPEDLLIENFKKNNEELKSPKRKIVVQEDAGGEANNNSVSKEDEPKKSIHTRITFDSEKDSLKAKYAALIKQVENKDDREDKNERKKSIMERLGKRPHESPRDNKKEIIDSRSIVKSQRYDKQEKSKEPAVRRLVMSKVSIPTKRPKSPQDEISEEEERKITLKEVQSVIKIKPRKLPPKDKQANASLLLKAVAEAQRSVSFVTKTNLKKSPDLSPPPRDPLFTRNYINKMEEQKVKCLEEQKKRLDEDQKITLVEDQKKRLAEDQKKKLAELLNEAIEKNEEDELRAKLLRLKEQHDKNGTTSQKFIITLDGVDKNQFNHKMDISKSIVKTKRPPSPIIFEAPKKVKLNQVPDKLTSIPLSSGLKSKEKCKFWPGCRQGEKCEFLHPKIPCKMFPNCKFEDKCLYSHPLCKFQSSCTRRDCPFSHAGKAAVRLPVTVPSGSILKTSSQICKFYPNCSNSQCPFLHLRLCTYGLSCKNKAECNFLHKPGNLSWRSDKV